MTLRGALRRWWSDDGHAPCSAVQDFRRLDVWRRAHALSLEVQRAAHDFPRGYSDLRTQLIRAADSIPSNIVEGCGAATRKELARYLDISIKSAYETDYRLQAARDAGLLPRARWRALFWELIEIRKMLCAFRRTVLDAEAADEDERWRRRRRRQDEEADNPPD